MKTKQRLALLFVALFLVGSLSAVSAGSALAAKQQNTTLTSSAPTASCSFSGMAGSVTWTVSWSWSGVYVNYVWCQLYYVNGGKTYGYNITEASRSGSDSRSSTYSAEAAYVILNMYDRTGNVIQSFAPLCSGSLI